MRACGATDIALHLSLGYTEQCNFEVAPEVLAAIGELGCTLAFSCYEYPAGESTTNRSGIAP